MYCIVLYCIVLYCIVLYCIVLYCIVLYCIRALAAIGSLARSLADGHGSRTLQREVRPISVLRFLISEVLTQAES